MTVLLLLILFGVVSYVLKLEIDRYKNFRSGQPLREWLIKNAMVVLADRNSTDPAQRAAGFMLEAVYDCRVLRSLNRMPQEKEMSHVMWDNLNSIMGKDFPLIVNGIKRLSLLMVLDKVQSGNAIREIYGDDLSVANLSVSESDAHSHQRAMDLDNIDKEQLNRPISQDAILGDEPPAPKKITRVVANRLEALVCH